MPTPNDMPAKKEPYVEAFEKIGEVAKEAAEKMKEAAEKFGEAAGQANEAGKKLAGKPPFVRKEHLTQRPFNDPRLHTLRGGLDRNVRIKKG